jgi:hypothetical protein
MIARMLVPHPVIKAEQEAIADPAACFLRIKSSGSVV